MLVCLGEQWGTRCASVRGEVWWAAKEGGGGDGERAWYERRAGERADVRRGVSEVRGLDGVGSQRTDVS